ncbi:hypothetical protein KGY72_09165 [Candidatus Bipolaricaulota bacterium]|nr:hypothetical protein [Candidatus Bipolaricaulota bacterium]
MNRAIPTHKVGHYARFMAQPPRFLNIHKLTHSSPTIGRGILRELINKSPIDFPSLKLVSKQAESKSIKHLSGTSLISEEDFELLRVCNQEEAFIDTIQTWKEKKRLGGERALFGDWKA